MQYEIICLRSVNTENQERIFQLAKQIATNRKPENIIPTIFLRLQAKGITATYRAYTSQPQHVLKMLPRSLNLTKEWKYPILLSHQGVVAGKHI